MSIYTKICTQCGHEFEDMAAPNHKTDICVACQRINLGRIEPQPKLTGRREALLKKYGIRK